jgi:hypothetical protein
MKTKIPLIIVGLAFALSGGALCVSRSSNKDAFGLFGRGDLKKPDAAGISAIDMSDDRNLLGFYHFVLVGKVVSQGETRQLDMFTANQYTINPILNIKGNLTGPVNVYGSGLQAGSTYIMCFYWNLNNWNLLTVSNNGLELLTSDPMLSNGQLRVLADGKDRVIALQRAYPNETFHGGDPNKRWNSYESLKSGHPLIPPPFDEAAPSTVPTSESVAPASEPAESVGPSVAPTPTTEPTVEPTLTPVPSPELTPTPEPTATPTPAPTMEVTPEPTAS